MYFSRRGPSSRLRLLQNVTYSLTISVVRHFLSTFIHSATALDLVTTHNFQQLSRASGIQPLFVLVPPDAISLQLGTLKVVGV
jgi:hypothetical protein